MIKRRVRGAAGVCIQAPCVYRYETELWSLKVGMGWIRFGHGRPLLYIKYDTVCDNAAALRECSVTGEEQGA